MFWKNERSNVQGEDANVDMEVVGQFMHDRTAERLFAAQDFGDGRLSDVCLLAQLNLCDSFRFHEVTQHVSVGSGQDSMVFVFVGGHQIAQCVEIEILAVSQLALGQKSVN